MHSISLRSLLAHGGTLISSDMVTCEGAPRRNFISIRCPFAFGTDRIALCIGQIRPWRLWQLGLVWVTDCVYLFFTELAPSRAYDSLTGDFSYALLTIVSLVASISVTWASSEQEHREKHRHGYQTDFTCYNPKIKTEVYEGDSHLSSRDVQHLQTSNLIPANNRPRLLSLLVAWFFKV
ncbi:hypothetical protein OPV22_025468 [Ensete ventricosum]|uniref:Uncharacterized protein n=1 Tax=Ensete ventricosum TaxID=4639 RepID=A0AAV8QHK7_ENSVE|nr:hypothetical protein OPV22_025468 [Ensete ventricosum]